MIKKKSGAKHMSLWKKLLKANIGIDLKIEALLANKLSIKSNYTNNLLEAHEAKYDGLHFTIKEGT